VSTKYVELFLTVTQEFRYDNNESWVRSENVELAGKIGGTEMMEQQDDTKYVVYLEADKPNFTVKFPNDILV